MVSTWNKNQTWSMKESWCMNQVIRNVHQSMRKWRLMVSRWITMMPRTRSSEDSVIVFTNKMGYNMNKQILGKERMTTDNFL